MEETRSRSRLTILIGTILIISSLFVATTNGDREFCKRICEQTSDKEFCLITVLGPYVSSLMDIDGVKGVSLTYGELRSKEAALEFGKMLRQESVKANKTQKEAFSYCQSVYKGLEGAYRAARAAYGEKRYDAVKFELNKAFINSRMCGNKLTTVVASSTESALFKMNTSQMRVAVLNMEILKIIDPTQE